MKKLMTEQRTARLMVEGNRNRLVKKWSPVIEKCQEVTSSKFSLFASMLENQYKHCGGKGNILTEEATTTGAIADFTRFALPLIRKSYPRLIADNLVGVQPMSAPASLIFYIRYRYAINKGQTVAGTQIMRQNTAQMFARQNGWALDPYYSSQTVKGEDLTIAPGGAVISGTLLHKPVLAGTVVVRIYASDSDNCEEAEPCAEIAFNASGTVDFVSYQSTGNTGCSSITIDESTSGAPVFDHDTAQVQITLSSGTLPANSIARADYEYDLENNPFQPEVTLSIDSDSVSATTRKLKTSWSLEAAQDLKAVHNIDAEGTMTDLMADEMVAEIDREILNDLIIASSIRAVHNFATAAGASVNFTDRNIALLYKTLEVANIIHRTTLRAPANWMVTSADIASKFEQLNDFRGSDALYQDGIDIGITSSGTIQGKLKLYKDPLFPNCKILLGFKGNSTLDSGYFYAPYIPLLSTPTVDRKSVV
jgi:DNA-binding protein YbaB